MKIHGFVFWKWFMVWLHCKKDMEQSQMIFKKLIVGSVYVMLQALSFDILFMWDCGSLAESP